MTFAPVSLIIWFIYWSCMDRCQTAAAQKNSPSCMEMSKRAQKLAFGFSHLQKQIQYKRKKSDAQPLIGDQTNMHHGN